MKFSLAVNLRIKVAAVLVLATLFAAPAVALSSCRVPGGHNAQHSCQQGCPMMAMADGRGDFEAQAQPDQGSTCCKISPDKTAPASQLLIPTTGSSLAPPAAHTMGSAIPASMQPHISHAASPPPIAPSRSVLCTFLI
jgi:hypothetical protein